jgi:hypothetical protein
MIVKGINNKASKEMAETLETLAGVGLLSADDKLKGFIRELYKLPEQSEEQPPVDIETEKKNLNSIEFDYIQLQENSRMESTYITAITKNENFINGFFDTKYIPATEELEKNIKKILNDGYSKAKIEKRGGANYIALTGNTGRG